MPNSNFYNPIVANALADQVRSEAKLAQVDADGLLVQKNSELQESERKRRSAEANAERLRHSAAMSTMSDGDTSENSSRFKTLAFEKSIADSRIRMLQEELEKKEALLLEWEHSNEAFKRLARKYGKAQGLSDEQRMTDLDTTLLEISIEDTKFQNTKIGKEAADSLAGSKN